MHSLHHRHEHHPHPHPVQHVYRRSIPIPDARLEALLPHNPSVVARAPATTTDSSDPQTTTCGPSDTTGVCQRPFSMKSNTVPIVLGVVIPLTIAFTILIILHRRHVKKLRKEDAEDENKALDFGMDGAVISEKKKRNKGTRGAEMSYDAARGAVRGDKGISMDMGVTSPYLLPPELHQSRESLRSLSRSMTTGDDKYRATTFVPDDGSIRSPSSLKSHWDDSSTYTGSSRRPLETDSTKNLIKSGDTVPHVKETMSGAPGSTSLLAPGAPNSNTRESYLSTTSSIGHIAAMRASNNYLGAYISGGQKTNELPADEPKPTVPELDGNPHPQESAATIRDRQEQRRSVGVSNAADFDFGVSSKPHQMPARDEPSELAGSQVEMPRVNVLQTPEEELYSHTSSKRQSSYYDDNFTALPNIDAGQTGFHADLQPHEEAAQYQSDHLHHAGQDVPEIMIDGDHEDYYESDEETGYDLDAYKEALGYDPRLLTMGMRPLPPDDPAENPEERALRIRSFYKEYFDEVQKPGGGNRLSYFDAADNYIDDYYGTTHSSSYRPRGQSVGRPATQQQRHRAMSNGTYGPRAFSSASGRYGQSRSRQMPKKRMPPPAPLMVLPTPHKLKEDSMLPNPMDYAPPQIFKNQRAGTPDSLRGGLRPYSPSTRAYNPLVSSFDDLAALPSPHQLRSSATFTSLDFAPPRFIAGGDASDSGSIKSNRSGVSALHHHNIRTGAYRVSKIPKEVAGTKIELASALRPQWDMNR